MSGLVGVYSRNLKSSNFRSKLIKQMADEIKYRASDDVDEWDDGIVALARVHHGVVNPESQPISNEDNNLFIFMDGEVFGYDKEKQELIKRGHRFKYENNDAEFCLHLYEEYGRSAFEKLNGSFLLVIYNRESKELILVNDRLSSRRLIYYCDGKHLVFGSQLRPILKFKNFPRRLDLRSIFEFCSIQKVLGYRTFFHDAKVLPSASFLHFLNGKLTIQEYWNLEFNIEDHPKEYYVDALVDALIEATKRRTRDNDRLGILLSGGLDSRMILAADKENRISTAFTLGDFKNREFKVAEKVAKLKGCRHLFLKRDLDHYVRMVDYAVDICDGMNRFDHAHFIGFQEDFIRNSDILFIGYAFNLLLRGRLLFNKVISIGGKNIELPLPMIISQPYKKQDFFKRLPFSSLSQEPEKLFNSKQKINYKDILNEAADKLLIEIETRKGFKVMDYLSHRPFFEYGVYLNIACIQAYIDYRLIILDNDLLEIIFSMPPEFRMGGIVYKESLKKLSPELFSIFDGGKNLPVEFPFWKEWLVMNSRNVLKKAGFSHDPVMPHPTYTNKSWPKKQVLINYNEELRDLIWNTINDPECLNPEIFNIERCKNIFYKHLNREGNYYEMLFLLLNFGRWHKKYVEH